ncbi:Pectate lyase superfamily protein [uncultured Caudovirales phage]|uniref:Pectate lyase superfamily protein n=1 Tax=uncultured Caudovirales phage TaxID=2100421 RepID=A0A6J5TB16_9CAUD|nr:Pectate lyase superfamily protein [uncultured Caudovirales phage]CAB5187170.1 Pectate lyase superfamily protein [uncultured Caudovirales phage]
MAVNISSVAGAAWQFFTDDGAPLTGGLIYTYLAGTTTPATTYTTSVGNVANANPIVLNAAGRTPAEIWLTNSVSYKFVVKTSTGVTVGTYDDLYGIALGSDLTSFQTLLAGSTGSSYVGFIQSGTGAVAETVQTKLREQISVKDYGATGDGFTDDTAFIQNAINANPGRIIFFPKGQYIFSSLTVTSDSTTLRGEGSFRSGTVLISSITTGNSVTFTGAQHSGIEDMYLYATVKKSSGFAVYFTGNSFQCYATNVRVDYYNCGFGIYSATGTTIEGCQCRYLLGNYGVYFAGTSSVGSYRAVINNFDADNPYILEPTTAGAWAATTSYSVGAVVYVSGAIWQCTQSGTSSAVPPSGYPGSTAQSVFTSAVTDGSVQWNFISLVSLYWISQDSYAYSLVVNEAAILNGGGGYRISNSGGTSASQPKWAFIWDMECDHNFVVGALCEGGEGVVMNSCWMGSCLTGNGVSVSSAYAGEFTLNASRVYGNAQHGILVANGPKSIIISNNYVGVNSRASYYTYHGITFAAGASEFVVSNNIIGELAGVVGNTQGYGVYIAAGASTNFTITGNVFKNNATAPISDNSTGTLKQISLNAGVGFDVPTTITVGASPFTWTNNTGAMASVTISSGTVSQVTLNGYQVSAATNVGVAVPQGAPLVVTYTAAPTMIYTN